MKKTLAALLVVTALTVSACGGSGETSDDRMKNRYEYCIEHGGSFEVTNSPRDEYKCVLPKQPTTPSPSTEFYEEGQ